MTICMGRRASWIGSPTYVFGAFTPAWHGTRLVGAVRRVPESWPSEAQEHTRGEGWPRSVQGKGVQRRRDSEAVARNQARVNFPD
jgi:hypothetical protein